MILKRTLVAVIVFGFFLLGNAFAQEEPSIYGTRKADPIFQERGLAIRGYDPVAYFNLNEPESGKKDFEFEFMGATWRFVSAENRDAFKNDPNKYLPQYGGYCAYGMSHGYAAPIDPAAWSIVDGKLYLNFSRDVRREWKKDIGGHIKRADVNWPKIPKKTVQTQSQN
ncbi:hypothetical protein L0244_22790 [bacterium]|nr:hypothetical protein [bacterium]MCI0615821.1 hypothetical protein [bacterium]